MKIDNEILRSRVGKGCFKIFNMHVTKCICVESRITFIKGRGMTEQVEFKLIKDNKSTETSWVKEEFVVFTNEELLKKIGLNETL